MPNPSQTAADSAPILFRSTIEVRWRDLDAYNHVNNSTYLTYLEQARLDWLQQLAGDWHGARSAPVMVASQLNYRAPINWPARVCVELACTRTGYSSMTLAHRIVDADATDRLYCDGDITLVWIDPSIGKPIALPDAIRAAVQPFHGETA